MLAKYKDKNEISKLIQKVKRDYISKEFEKCENNARILWKTELCNL